LKNLNIISIAKWYRKLKIIIKNTTNTGREGRARMLTERLKRLFSQQASEIDYATLLAPIPVIGYLIYSLAH
jgi:hypothetical protein